jgi:cell wall-associated NlpC family hydrolase
VSDFQDLVTRLDLMQLLAQNDASLVREVRGARAQIEQTKQTLELQRAAEKQSEAKELKEYKKVQKHLAEQKSYLSSLNGKVARLVAEERARREEQERRQAEEEARRIKEEQERRQAQAAQESSESKNGSSKDGSSGTSGSDKKEAANAADKDKGTTEPAKPTTSLGGAHPEVVTEARKYIGVSPYVWGGASPSGFDCSGLTQYCYRVAAGITLPRTSRSQFSAGSFIPPDRKDLLKPGDLVFFGTNANASLIHHVGIYSGNSLMIHAPQTGQKIKESYAFRSDYVGAVRP